ncbi:putative calcium-transporting ATPase 13, plasma membrane-type [Ziziphus jujuba]|uniref:Calcium-transporting ATPase n=1 Tax=Ziziphus jujuba TaxID=326968 RepID=A0A6P3YTL5_ZIZJJ|nr:putative calcium-transporting ATPase 13, plasma membrane-type [Ziziphus jujuba]
MSPGIFHTNLACIESLLQIPNTISVQKKKWRSAFVTIYCSRALLSIYKKSVIKKCDIEIPLSFSYTVIDVKPVIGSFQIDQTSLVELLKEKNLAQLQQLGGIDGVVSALKTGAEQGISSDDEEVAARREAFGSNTYTKPPSKGFLSYVWEAFQDLTIIILMVCAALSLGFGMKVHGAKEGWIDGVSIIIAIFLVIAVSAISNFRQNRQFDKLSKVSNNIQIDVLRGGRRQKNSIFEILVGDVICLKIGDQVPADGLFLEGHSLQIDESSMTGESDHVEINHGQNPFLFSGTKVVDGYGRMVVTSVGMNTTWGQMMSQLSRDSNEQTPLQARLNKLTSSIGKVGLAVAFIVLVVLFVRYFTGTTKDENGNQEFIGGKTKFDDILNSSVEFIAAAVTIVVVAIPEGLPLAVTLTLAYSMKRMMADKAMVRKLSACETMGSATTICTDKTGTLTMNQMKVTKFWLGKESTEQLGAYSSVAPYVIELFREGIALNTTGSVYRPSFGMEYEITGSPTEKAILSWAVEDLNMDMEEITRKCSILHVEAFNSKKKRSGVLLKRKIDGSVQVHWKGAAEMILAMCSSYYDASGIIKDLDDNQKSEFQQIIQGMAASSLRCIAFAHNRVQTEEVQDSDAPKSLKEEGLVLLGLVGIKDPCRPGVKRAVEDCQYAGVNVKMITGDNVFTAKAIATECGILRPGQDIKEAIIEGEKFRNYTEEERMEKVDKICVMARSSPFDKLLMVQCLKRKGHVVGVTGDGTNDAPALKEADIGLSMGIQGTEVAKESSDIVILDDNFASVATVLKWGRCVYNNIQKFIQFQLTVNVAALVINFVAAVSAGKVPLTAVQLLWVNLIMDTLGALALATERPTKELMDKPPVGRTAPLITNIMWRNLLPQALYQISVLLILQFKGKSIFGVDEKVKDTLIFNTFVLCQVFNEFNARKLEKKNVFKGIHRNRLFMGIIAITIVLQVIMVEFLKKFADTERLSWGQWGICIGIASMSWPIGWVVKFIPVAEKPFFSYLKIKKYFH